MAALLRDLMPERIVTPARVRRRGHDDGLTRARGWLASEGDTVVGWAEARLRWGGSQTHRGSFWIGVRPEQRGRGIGTALYERTQRHLDALGALVERSHATSDEGRQFLERRGFRPGLTTTFSSLDPEAVEQPERPAPPGFTLGTVTELADRPRDLFTLYAATERDLPGEHGMTEDEYDEWLEETLHHPDLARDGSFVVLDAAARPVALAWLIADLEQGRAENEMTGTLRELRGRGLARAAKLATIRWAAANGITTILTSNHDENAPMLGLNRSLGYRPLVTSVDFNRER